MSKNFVSVQTKDLVALLDCFTSADEFEQFCTQMSVMVQEIKFTSEVQIRNSDDGFVSMLQMKQLFLLTLFCRENFELIRELVGKLKYDPVDDQEAERLKKESPRSNLDRSES